MLWASEFIDAARDVYNANKAPYTIVDGRDIRDVDPSEVLEKIDMKPGELDLLDGSPPCASFSAVGKKDKGWGENKKYSDKVQRTDDLFFEYVRFVRAIQPRVFVAENVAGLVKGAAKGYFLDILRELKACGYRVEARLLDAQWLGVPQQRERLIFVGVREDLGRNPAFPTPLGYRYSMREAFEGLQAPVEPETDISRYAIGDAYDWLTPGKWSDRFMSLGYRSLDEPSFTVTAQARSSTAGIVHPEEKRKFSIGELKRICSFPDDFQLPVTYAQQYERLGRAVPPLMAAAIATAIRDQVLIPAITTT
jgi:DNA (cytosine-5)-methyltransferase 1